MTDAEIIERFVAVFTGGEPLMVFRDSSLPKGVNVEDLEPLLVTPWDEDGCALWRPTPIQLAPEALDRLYESIPGPLPPLYERLIGSYYFGDVEVGSFRLLPNFPPALDGLVTAIKEDKVMYPVLAASGLLQFGRGPEYDYDPFCFDTKRRLPDGDCPIVRFDHEEILVDRRLGVATAVADSFRQLVMREINEGER